MITQIPGERISFIGCGDDRRSRAPAVAVSGNAALCWSARDSRKKRRRARRSAGRREIKSSRMTAAFLSPTAFSISLHAEASASRIAVFAAFAAFVAADNRRSLTLPMKAHHHRVAIALHCIAFFSIRRNILDPRIAAASISRVASLACRFVRFENSPNVSWKHLDDQRYFYKYY